jgi:hypothetical protein
VSIKRPAGSAALSAEGLSIQVIPSNTVPFTTLSADLNIDTSIFVPVGCTPPVGWTCQLSVAPAVFWGFNEPSDAILPGMTRGGYRLVSPALPRIVDGFVKPRHVLFTEGDEFQESDRERGRLEVAAITVPLRLLGPVPPPEPLDLAAYTAMIAAELPEAQALGWIDTSTTLDTLLGPLGGLELALQQDRTSDAKAIASSLIAQVSESSCTTIACSEKPLSVEAFALLNFNLRFIRSKLPNSAPDCSAAVASPNLFWPPVPGLTRYLTRGLSDVETSQLESPLDFCDIGVKQRDGLHLMNRAIECEPSVSQSLCLNAIA